MVILVGAHLIHEAIWIYDSEKDKFENRIINIILHPWEIEKVDQYFENFVQVTNVPIDCFYLFYSWPCYNRMLKKFIETSKKYNIAKVQLIDPSREYALASLEYMRPDSDSLCIFACHRDRVLCLTWTIDKNNQLNVSQSFVEYLKSTTDKNSVIEKIQMLSKKVNLSTLSPTVAIFYTNDMDLTNMLIPIFNDYSKKTVLIKFENNDYLSYRLSSVFIKQLKNEIIYTVQPMLGRLIMLNIDYLMICNFPISAGLPIHREYTWNLTENDNSLKIYEDTAVTQTIPFPGMGKVLIKFDIDINGMSTTDIEQKGIITSFPILRIDPGINCKHYKIPSKLLKYDPKINAVGIDLGTADCYACVIRQNGPDGVVLDPYACQRNLPSYVDINEIYFPCGQNIINRMETKSNVTAFNFKQLIGKDVHEVVKDPLWPYEIINYCEQIFLLFKAEDRSAMVKSATDICTYLLEQIKKLVEEYQGTKLDRAVITVPSTFTQNQRNALRNAAIFAKWTTTLFLTEPIAALIACLYEFDIPNISKVLLFDCGDGTTDICAAEICGTDIKILVENGDAELGGKNLDKILINYFGKILRNKYNVDVYDTKIKYRLLRKCREIKHTLSVVEEGMLFVDDFIFNNDDVITITRQEFEIKAAEFIRHKRYLIVETMAKAKLSADDIDIIFLVGGSSRIPIIQRSFLEMFPKAQLKCSKHPEELVAKGAAIFYYSKETEYGADTKKTIEQTKPNEDIGSSSTTKQSDLSQKLGLPASNIPSICNLKNEFEENSLGTKDDKEK